MLEKIKKEKAQLIQYYKTDSFMEDFTSLSKKGDHIVENNQDIKTIEAIFTNNRDLIFFEKSQKYGIIYQNFVLFKYFDWTNNKKTYVIISKHNFLNKQVYQ